MHINPIEKISDASDSQRISQNKESGIFDNSQHRESGNYDNSQVRGSDVYDVEKPTLPSLATFENHMSHNIDEEEIMEDHKVLLEKRSSIKQSAEDSLNRFLLKNKVNEVDYADDAADVMIDRDSGN